MTEKELDLIRQGLIPIRFVDGLPEAIKEPFFERMRFLCAVAKGYMTLYRKVQIRKKLEGNKCREL